ncbi:DNA cytosine methyltransferase [Burkholderia thailandensis]|uniref:DNA cytosine methyltransferase n=1 Tax=Burkholderia thailandensis TaxID=57975 RepID=UPI0009B80371|nr:DNA cytosine methyltransferase [Burkholderia thailandensis]PNE70354.1 DNA cytosine methyltransferase [Burkholderia thailandensis]PNE70424.1 DNA cytosine methyltransferase [Burkholderia thailandensis]
MAAYYNEHDPYAVQWLRNLIAAGHIAPGDVDERSIEDVRPDDLRAYDQCHFFAGIGVWSHALRRAGWPDDRSVWTGSCPCQPFSSAGKGAGFDDERHLWPAWYWLIGECRPAVIFGEQVASSAVEPWIDLVHADMEALDYPFGCVPFPSAGVGSPHIRDRVYWMAYAHGRTRGKGHPHVRGRVDRGDAQSRARSRSGRMSGRLADYDQHGRGAHAVTGLHDVERDAESRCSSGGLADADVDGLQGCTVEAIRRTGRRQEGHAIGRSGASLADGFERIEPAGPTNGVWRDADWLLCRDGKWRPVEPGTFPLVDGTAGSVGRVRADQERLAALRPRKDQGSCTGRLRGYGNAINAEAATQFILAARDILN